MYNRLTEAIKKRIIYELRRFWSYDPVYRDDLVPHIQGKYSFRERPCAAIILKGQSASHERLAADNFQGTVISYVHLSKVGNNPGLAVEWVREDGRAVQDNGGVFPSARGIYYIEVLEELVSLYGVTEERRVFYVDPLLEVIDEEPMQLSAFDYQIEHYPLHPGSLRVFELPGNIPQVEGVNFTADYTTGVITLASPLPPGTELSIDYRYPGESRGPYILRDNHTNVDAIPGVVLAFGRRSTPGDIMAVIVGDRREPVALEYGGRWSISLDLDVMALDVHAQGEITDRTLLYIEGPLRSRLASEGIEILEVSMGGESEEIYDENADDYFYNASLSMSIQTDWTIHVPLDALVRRVVPQTAEEIEAAAAMTDEELVAMGEPNHYRAIQQLGLLNARDPFFVGRSQTYEVIK